MRENDIEDEWTIIQGQVYGDRINEAIPFEGVLPVLHKLKVEKILITQVVINFMAFHLVAMITLMNIMVLYLKKMTINLLFTK